MQEDVQIANVTADINDVWTTQRRIDRKLLNIIAWGYECGDSIESLHAEQFNNVSSYIIGNGNHRTIAQHLLQGAVTFSKVFAQNWDHSLERLHHLKKTDTYPAIYLDGQWYRKPGRLTYYRPLREIPATFQQKIHRLLEEQGFILHTKRCHVDREVYSAFSSG